MSYDLCTSVLLISASVHYSLLRLRIAFSVSVTADINNRLGCSSILKAGGCLESQANFLLRYTII